MTLALEEVEILPVTQDDLIREQRTDPYCRAMMEEVGKSGTQLEFNQHGLLCRYAPLDGSIQIVVPASLRARVSFLSHYLRLQGHPGTSKMYETMRRLYYWPHMASDVQQTVADSQSCARVRGTQHRHQKKLTSFPAAGPLEFIAMDLYGPLPKKPTGTATYWSSRTALPSCAVLYPFRRHRRIRWLRHFSTRDYTRIAN